MNEYPPQAIAPLLEREASGIVHLLLSSSLQKTVFAALARPVAGTIKSTLVVTLPGSVKAVKENIEALLNGGVLDHAVELIRGGTGKKLHSQLAASQSDGGSVPQLQNDHHHHHHHHEHRRGDHSHAVPQARTTLSHDPSAPGMSLRSFDGSKFLKKVVQYPPATASRHTRYVHSSTR